jgi:tyrosyl-tRNA synthetase
MAFLSPQDQLDRLKDTVPPVEIIEEAELLDKLERSRAENRPLRVKQGFDASAPDLHLGHAVSIWKLKTFQELGHRVIFLIGDFTGMVGDPSGKSKTRPRLTREQVEVNAQTYREQVFKILDPELTELRFNSEWHAGRNIYDFLDLTSHYTVHRMLERDDFEKRFKAEDSISLLEFLYPLIQAYDSVALKADVELGGTDQKFNLVLARHIQRAYGLEPQSLFLMPLLTGTDGVEKMSKSLGNYIGITDTPEDIYGKVMSIPDAQLEVYFRLASSLTSSEIEARFPPDDPCALKHELAKHIVARYHGSVAADKACDAFFSRFRDRDLPTPAELIACGAIVKVENEIEWLPRVMVTAGAVKSNSEALRLIKANAVGVDGVKISPDEDLNLDFSKPRVVKVGKRRFFLVEGKRQEEK